MATRIIKLLGKAYSTNGDVNLVVNFDNTQVFSGTVNTINGIIPDSPVTDWVELATFSIDTSLTGNVPLSIQVSNGDLHFVKLIGNYAGYESTTDEQGNEIVTVQPEDYYDDLNINDDTTDGKTNVVLDGDNGEPQSRTVNVNDSTTWGDWGYRVYNGVTFKCDFLIDPRMTVTEV